MRDYRNIIQQVANKNGVSYAEAYRDMQEAVSAAYHSDDLVDCVKYLSQIFFDHSNY